MKTLDVTSIPPALMAELQQAVEDAATGIRNPDSELQACAEMDRAREEMRQEVGEVNVAVELVRAVRDES